MSIGISSINVHSNAKSTCVSTDKRKLLQVTVWKKLESLRRPTDRQILNCDEMFSWVSNNVANIKFFFVTFGDVIQHIHNIQTRLIEATLDETRSHHLFWPGSRDTVGVMHTQVINTHSYNLHSKQLLIDIKQLKSGQYITAVYMERWYVCLVTEVCSDERDVC